MCQPRGLVLALLIFVPAGADLLSACAPTCRSPNECELGSYCQLSGSDSQGTCQKDCKENSDCEVDESGLFVAVCNEDGQCRPAARPPKVRVLTPENDTLLAEGTRDVALSGTVETAAESAQITIQPIRREGCLIGRTPSLFINNPNPGSFSEIPFVLDDLDLDSGVSTIDIRAQIGGAYSVLRHLLEVSCPSCATIRITNPMDVLAVPGLELSRLGGQISPTTVTTAIWRVKGEAKDVFDGRIPVLDGVFQVSRLPLFAGFNRVEVVVTGVGDGLGESRCSAAVTAGVARETGLRTLLSWDGPTSDLDLHVVLPGGRFGVPDAEIPRNDDNDGYGPEVASAESLMDGVYGVIAEAWADNDDPGSNAFVNVLTDGRFVVRGAIGPQYLSDRENRVWMVGALRVQAGVYEWTTINRLLDPFLRPTETPEEWVATYRTSE